MAGKKNIARDGAPKLIAEVPAHPGMTFRESIDGVGLVRFGGISKTQLAHAMQSGGVPITEPNPNIEKTYTAGQVPTYPTQALRREHTATRGDASAILTDASNLGRPKK
jgi:hypothetical protein